MASERARHLAAVLKVRWGLHYQDLPELRETIDREASLPALEAVAKAAKEYFEKVDSRSRPGQYMKKRKLRAALAKLEEKG